MGSVRIFVRFQTGRFPCCTTVAGNIGYKFRGTGKFLGALLLGAGAVDVLFICDLPVLLLAAILIANSPSVEFSDFQCFTAACLDDYFKGFPRICSID